MESFDKTFVCNRLAVFVCWDDVSFQSNMTNNMVIYVVGEFWQNFCVQSTCCLCLLRWCLNDKFLFSLTYHGNLCGVESFDKTFVCNRLAVWMEALTSWRLICHKTPHHIIHKKRPQRKDNFMQTTIWELRGGFLKQESKVLHDSDYCGNFMHKTPTLSLSLDKRDSGTGQTYPDNLTCLIVHWSHETTMCMLQQGKTK